MKSLNAIIILLLTLLFSGCITKFIPETTENQELIVVEGLVTDQPEPNIIKLSKSMPLGKKSIAIPLNGCNVYILDNFGNTTLLEQTDPGTYSTDPSVFRGIAGRKYTLKIVTNSNNLRGYTYESLPMELKPVPVIDSIYYRKILLQPAAGNLPAQEACQIYLDTHDEADKCKFYRWDFSETWEFQPPFSYPLNRNCWITDGSSSINIKNTSILSENRINGLKVNYINGESDKLKIKYSIIVNQYSVNQNEFDYWERLQSFTEEVGSLYDITPASIPSNISCIENPGEPALGYFSVSAKSSKRIMINEYFSGIVNLYSDCISDTIYNGAAISGLNSFSWILEDRPWPPTNPPYQVITNIRGCADCTVRGTKNKTRFLVRLFIMIKKQYILMIMLFLNSCITEFIPQISEDRELLVVEGLITDQFRTNKVKLSKSKPQGEKIEASPLKGCSVSIFDNLGNNYSLTESDPGTYITDSTIFRGVVGRSYVLHISTNEGGRFSNYESYPVVMKPVPPIDSIYYEKRAVRERFEDNFGIDGCQIYLNSRDPANTCRYYRWDFTETWVLRLLFPVENIKCWVSDYSRDIYVSTSAALAEDRIERFPVTYISNVTDRLLRQYSIEVTQYSLSEEEYNYWKKLKNLTVSVGGLHDVIPSSIPGNIKSLENPGEKVLGFFSVSAASSKRIFIKDDFAGIIDQYPNCPADTIYGDYDPPELNVTAWTIIDHPAEAGPRMRVLTHRKECADCTTRGTNIKPDYWKD